MHLSLIITAVKCITNVIPTGEDVENYVNAIDKQVQYVYMVKVEVEQGWLEGELLIASLNQTPYYSFKGIPYARPPIERLRFMAPQPPRPWSGIRNATKHGSKCTQTAYLERGSVSGNEDCLFINVYSPNIKPEIPLSVMFFIPGGHFESGSGDVDDYSPDFLINYNVAVVTINYRLGALGFLSLDTPKVPGNAGLKDQVAALKWVQKNIKNFGGDLTKVTIFGQSAGGASVSLHLVSPSSKGLFIHAISMSGVFLNDWATTVEPRARAFSLGKQLGLQTLNITELYEFLQGVPADELTKTNADVFLSDNVTRALTITTDYAPIVEKKFFIKDQFLTEGPRMLLRNGIINNSDLMIGHVNEEGLYFIAKLQDDILKYYPTYKTLFIPRKVIKIDPLRSYVQLANTVYNHYYDKKLINFETLDIFVRFFSYYYVVYDVHRYIDMTPDTKQFRRYFYRFSGVSERNVYAQSGAKYGIVGASHNDDRMYLLDAKRFNLTVVKGSKSYKLIHNMCTLFTNYAKTGNPTPNKSLGTIWRKYDQQERHALDVAEDLTQIRIFFNNTELGF